MTISRDGYIPKGLYVFENIASSPQHPEVRVTFADNLPQPVFEADAEGTITYVNRTGSEILGWDPGELIGKSIFELLAPECRQEAMDRFRAKVQGRLSGPSMYTVVRKAGSSFPAVVHSAPVTTVDGREGLRGIIVDMTAAREAQERFRTLFEAIPDTVFVKDRDLRYTQVNPAMTSLVGVSETDIVGKTDRELFDGETAAWIEDHDRRVLEGETVETENRFVIRGRPVIAHVIKVPLRDGSGRITGICGIARDVTARRRTEDALRESEGRYRTVIEHSNDGVAIVAGDRHVFVNRRFLDLFGIEEENDVLEGAPYFWIHPDDREMVIDRNRKRQKGENAPAQYEFRGLRPDGSLVHVEVSAARMLYRGQPVTIAFLRDVTERARAAEALDAERRRLFDIIEFLPDATFVIDNDKKVIAWNRAIEIMTGVPKENILQRGDYAYAEAFYGEKRPMLIDLVQEHQPGIEEKYHFMRWSGHEVYAEAFVRPANGRQAMYLWGVASPLFDGEGRRIGAIESVRDITERKQLEAQLLHSQKMEAIGNLASGVAHDFNNILSVIMGYASVLGMRLEQGEGMGYVNEILAAAERAKHLTGSLLAFARKQVMDLRPVEINEMVKGAGRLLSRLLTEDIEFVVEPGQEDLVVMADRVQLEQVLMNLVINAKDAMPGGGRITIATRGGFIDRTFISENGFGREGRYAVILCSDTGMGIDETVRARLFEPFFTTKEKGKGTGLGLPMVYGIVKQHGGYIRVESEMGRGSVFSVFLPLVAIHGPAEQRTTANAVPGGHETILLAEDEETLRRLVKDVLESFGYTVLDAGTGDEAMDIVARHKDRIDLMILDVVMPGRNGREVYEEARTLRPGLKAVFCSGYTDDVLLQRGVLRGECHLLTKPVSPEDLLRTVRQVLDEEEG